LSPNPPLFSGEISSGKIVTRDFTQNNGEFATTRALATHALSIDFAQLPAHTIAHTKLFIEDTLGVALCGHAGSFSASLLASCVQMGGVAEARVIGKSLRLPAAHAAMVNAYLIHCMEFDCVHEPAVVHPMAVILASLLAYVDRKPDISGAQLLSAIVAAVEVATCLGTASRSQLRFFRPAQCGALGASLGLAKLAGWSVDQAINYWGVLLGQLSGTMQAHREGSASLPMQIAVNARNVLYAFDFASAGLHGPIGALEGEFGYLNLFEGEHDFPSAMADRLAQTKRGQFAIDEVSHKPFPSGRATHGGLQALKLLQAQHGFQTVDITQVTLYAPPLICQLVDRPMLENASSNYLRLCFPFCAAQLLSHGQLSPLEFHAQQSPAFYQLADKISVVKDDNSDVNALRPVRVVVECGEDRYELTLQHILGSPNSRLSAAAHREKFERNIAVFAPVHSEAISRNLSASIQRIEHHRASTLLDACAGAALDR
jgi:aconitate decarboxylase